RSRDLHRSLSTALRATHLASPAARSSRPNSEAHRRPLARWPRARPLARGNDRPHPVGMVRSASSSLLGLALFRQQGPLRRYVTCHTVSVSPGSCGYLPSPGLFRTPAKHLILKSLRSGQKIHGKPTAASRLAEIACFTVLGPGTRSL